MGFLIVSLCQGFWIVFMILPAKANTCDGNCISCADINGEKECKKCNDSYWLSETLCVKCSTNCATCSNSSSCETCKPGFYSPSSYCNAQCSVKCSNGLCNKNTGHCTQCPSGRYGYYCDFDCSLCKNEQCELRQCTNGCKTGYWHHQNGNISECKPCLKNCSSCDDGSTCNVCNDGTYHNAYTDGRTYCNLCSIRCAKCSAYTQCLSCKPEYYGHACDFNCTTQIPNCYLCDWNAIATVSCIQCDIGYTLQDNKCIHNLQQCPLNCETCTISNVCELCKTGWYGEKCNKCRNISNCVACQEMNDTVICTVCDDGYTVMNGVCMETTTKPTSTSIMSTSLPITTNPTTKMQQGQISEQSDNKIIIFGAVAGGVGLILVGVVLVIVCFKQRKRKSRNTNNQPVEAIDRCPPDEDLTDYPVYAQPNKVKKTQQPEEYLYAQPIKLKTTNKPMESDVEGAHQSSTSSRTTSLDLEAVIVESGVDTYQLETLDGEITSDIELGADIPSSDTYYNVEGLLRSRVQVSNLLEYVRKKNDFDTEFQKLPKGLQRSCNEALKVHNRKKNRFNGIYAYDATRVELKTNSFINANYIDGYNQSNAYIASLGPTSDTMNAFSTFWEMVWQDRFEAIVMLTNLEEGGKMKCEQYWPNPGATKTCHDYKVKCQAEHVFAEFTVRELTLEMNGSSEKRETIQYHYTAWPDRYVPDTVASLVEFRDKVESGKRKSDSPLVVHCSAGIGRTGTYIALDMLIKEGRDCNYVDLFGCALGLRGQRVQLIQNEVQYEYLHHAVLYSLTCDTEPLPITAVKKLTGQRISTQFKALASLPVQSNRLSSWSSNYEHREENRPGSDIPGERYRVRLQFSIDDYINAVYVNSYQRKDAFIAAQTPMPSTIEHFLCMVYHERCSCIVDLDEEDKTNQSVLQYLPAVKDSSIFGQYQIQCNDVNFFDGFIVRDIAIKIIGSPPSEQLSIRHFQLKNWKKDEDVPPNTKRFMHLVKEVAITAYTQTSSGPVVLHCLTGSQRCGIFLAVSTMMEKVVKDRHVSGIHTVCHIRKQRNTALQKPEMLKYCYQCVADCIHSSSSKDTYYNVMNLRQ